MDKKYGSSIDGINNNVDTKNVHIKISFSSYNITSANIDTNIDINNTNRMDNISEKVINKQQKYNSIKQSKWG